MSTFMQLAIEQAQQGLREGGVPIGSVLVMNGAVIGAGHNQRQQMGSAIRHAEMDALENAGRLGRAEYDRCTIYTTLSPCIMCTGAILLYQIPRVVIGENRTFPGEPELLRARGIEVTILEDAQCIELMETFIREQPELWNEDIGV
ncbi:MAG: nucleoside deaminase [Pirellulaceae bacterium]